MSKTTEKHSTVAVSAKASTKKPLITIKTLVQRGILIDITIGAFTGIKKDKQASAELITENYANKSAARVTKNLLKGDETKLITKAAQELRNTFVRLTLDWDKETRICPIKRYIEVKLELERLKTEYLKAAKTATDKYLEMVDSDKIRLGGLFDPNDYPSAETYRQSFYVTIAPRPVPSDDFRTGSLSESDINQINEDIRLFNQSAVNQAEQDIFKRVLIKVTHAVTKLNNPDDNAKFHDSTINNVLKIITEVRTLNFTESPEIEMILNETEKSFKTMTPSVIRENKAVRSDAADKAKEALAKINAMLKNF